MARNIQIEKNVPLPDEQGANIPLKRMEIGDSVFVDGEDLQGLAAQVYKVSKKQGMKFVQRREGAGIRVWREA